MKPENRRSARPPRQGALKRARLVLGACAAAAAFLLALEWGYRGALALAYRRTNVFEIYAIGESTTAGQPYSRDLAFPSLAAAMFDGRLAGKSIALHNLSRPGYSLYPHALALTERLRLRDRRTPAVVMVYVGHNEAFTAPRSSDARLLRYEAFKERIVYRSFLARDLLCSLEALANFRGIRTLAIYEFHLRMVIEESLRAGATPILSTVIGNTSGVEPNVACPAASRGDVAAWARAAASEEAADPGRAAGEYRAAALASPCLTPFAEYRLGKLERAAGRPAAARLHFARATDADPHTNFGRATSAQNELIRRLAREYSVPLVDAVALFERASPQGIVGDELMSDGHHPNMKGDLLLARAFAEAMSSALHEPIRREFTGPPEAFAWASYGDAGQADTFLENGQWLLWVSGGHPFPRDRMRLAAENFKNAAALEPSRFEAWAGEGLALTTPEGAVLADKSVAALIRRLVSTRPGRPLLASPELFALAVKLLENNCPEDVVRRILETAGPRLGDPPAADAPSELLRAALDERARGNHEQAAARLRLLAQAAPGGNILWTLSAEDSFLAKDRRAALDSLVQAEKLESDPIRLLRLADLHGRLGDLGGAARIRDAVGARCHWDKRSRASLAEAALAAGDRALALEALVEAESLERGARDRPALERARRDVGAAALSALPPRPARRPDDAATWVLRADAALQAGDRASARQSLAAAEALKANGADRRRIAESYLELGDAPRALALDRRLLEARPSDPALWIDRAVAALAAGEPAAARESLNAAGKLAPDDEDQRRAALAWQELKEYDRAIEILDELARRHPETAGYFSDRGLCRDLAGARGAAISDLERALRLDPGLMPAALTLGSIYVEEKRDADARALYDRVLARPPAAADAALRAVLLKSREALDARRSPP